MQRDSEVLRASVAGHLRQHLHALRLQRANVGLNLRQRARGRLWTEVAHTGVAAGEHLAALVSDRLRAMGITPSGALADLRDGHKVWVGEVVVSHQRPPTARGTAFLAPADEGGLINVVLRPKVYEDSRKAKSPFVVVEGRLQKQGQAISVLARRVIALEASP